MTKKSGILLCYPLEEERLLKWKPPYIVQPKLDGDRCRAVYNKIHGWQLLSSSSRIFPSMPHIIRALSSSDIPTSVELDGELYNPNLSFEEIHGRVSRTVNLHPDYQNISYYIFDIVDESLPQWKRLQNLNSLKQTLPPETYVVPYYLAENIEGIIKICKMSLSAGFEGIIVRDFNAHYVRKRSPCIMKYKPKKDDYYTIVGYKQMIDKNGQPKDMLGALICRGDDGTEFSVGSGLDDTTRLKYWPVKYAETLLGKTVHIQYQHLTSGNKIPRFPVLISIG